MLLNERQNIKHLIEKQWDSSSNLRTLVQLMLTIFGVYLCYQMALPFLSIFAWALALGVLFKPMQSWLQDILKKPSLAAVICIVFIALIVVVPFLLAGEQLVQEAISGSQLIETKINSGEWQRSLEKQPQLAPLVSTIEHFIDFPSTLKILTGWLAKFAGIVVKNSIYQLLELSLVFYVLFFFLRDRELILTSISSLSPLSQSEMDDLFIRISDTIHATVYGTFAISAVQGILGGLMFWWLGLPAPFLWGLMMSLLAIVPILGAFVIWAPAAIFLALEGQWGSAITLALWGSLVVGTIDNLLRPMIVGNRLKLHTVLIFLSVVGGLILYGAAGLILGPVTLTITIRLLKVWSYRSL